MARTMTTSATRQEQRVVTQEVRATSTVLANDSQVKLTYNLIGNEIRNQFIHGRDFFTDKVLLFWTSEMNSLLNESRCLCKNLTVRQMNKRQNF